MKGIQFYFEIDLHSNSSNMLFLKPSHGIFGSVFRPMYRDGKPIEPSGKNTECVNFFRAFNQSMNSTARTSIRIAMCFASHYYPYKVINTARVETSVSGPQAKLIKLLIPVHSQSKMVVLTTFQVQAFREQGFLVLRANEHSLVDATDLQNWTNEVADWPRLKGKWMPYDEVTASGQKLLMRTEKFADYHTQFGELLFGSAIADVLKQLSGEVRD
jgi:hypothetical protein